MGVRVQGLGFRVKGRLGLRFEAGEGEGEGADQVALALARVLGHLPGPSLYPQAGVDGPK